MNYKRDVHGMGGGISFTSRYLRLFSLSWKCFVRELSTTYQHIILRSIRILISFILTLFNNERVMVYIVPHTNQFS